MNGSWCNDDFAAALKVATVALTDSVPHAAQVAYLFGEAPDNEGSVLHAASRLYLNGRVRMFYICCNEGGRALRGTPDGPISYAGYNAWAEKLNGFGVHGNAIKPMVQPELPSHSGNEAKTFVALAKENRWERVLCVAPPFHAMRALVNMVTFIRRLDVSLRVWSVAGDAQAWHKPVVYSQGATVPSRLDAIDGEWNRINRVYGNEYDLASCAEVPS